MRGSWSNRQIHCGLFAVFISMKASSTNMKSLCTLDWINWEVGFCSISPLLVSGILKVEDGDMNQVGCDFSDLLAD